MAFKERNARHLIIILSLSCFFLVAVAAGVEVELPQNVFFYSPVASVTGQNAVWINPAALARKWSGSMFIVTHRDNRIIRDWGSVSTVGKLGIAYRYIKGNGQPNHKEMIFAFGSGRRTQIGISYRYITQGAGYLNKRHLWNAGLLFRNSPTLTFGARAENLNRGKINGQRSDIRFVYGIAARTYDRMVTVTFDVDMTSKESLKSADFRTGVEIRPIPGMFIYGDVDNHSRISLGFRLNFDRSYVGHRLEYDRNEKTYMATSYLGEVRGRQASLTKPRRQSLMIGLDGYLPENPENPFFGRRPLRFFDYIHGIYQAADDNEIDRIFLQINSLRCGLAKVEELADALNYFKSQGKPVYAYLSSPNNLGYLLASMADSIIIPPVSQVRLTGLHAELMMYKDLLDKLGVQLELERVDEYKTATEPYIFNRPTEPNRQQLNRLLDSLYNGMVATIAGNRKLSEDSVKNLIDNAPLTSVEAENSGLVDKRAYLDEAKHGYAGPDIGIDFYGLPYARRVSLSDYVKCPMYDDAWVPPPQIAILIADGEIAQGKRGGKIGTYDMVGAIRQVRYNPEIVGAVLRINSPGGDALASDILWHEIRELGRNKPLVISMGNLAASGGYYIASLNDKIFADENTLTGSIGVFGGKVNFSKLYEKLGIYTELFNRGENASMYSTAKPFSDAQRKKLRKQLWKFYDHFVDKVAKVRPIDADSVNALGRGQVWTGTEAVRNGLIDEIGGVHQALAFLLEKIGLSEKDVKIVTLPEKQYFFKNPFNVPYYSLQLFSLIRGKKSPVSALKNFTQGNIFYRLPYDIDIE